MSNAHLDTYLELLSDRQRRKIIRHLRDENAGKATVENLVECLHEGESAPLTAERSERERLTIQLVHSHLPKLDEYGIIQYDQQDSVVRYQPDEQIETLLDALPTEAAQITPEL